jgi:hypothetical protein
VPERWNSNPCPDVGLRPQPERQTDDFSRPRRPPANVHPTSRLMGLRLSRRRPASHSGVRVDEPKPIIIDSNRPQHHPVSARHDRAGRRGKHRGSTIRELVRRSRARLSGDEVLDARGCLQRAMGRGNLDARALLLPGRASSLVEQPLSAGIAATFPPKAAGSAVIPLAIL